MSITVIQHVLSRLHEIGIKDIFGVAGDYAFSVEDAICSDKNFRWMGDCDELNAAYAADGYARIHGLAALNTNYCVGELSAINGGAGSYTEFLTGVSLDRHARRLLSKNPDLYYNDLAQWQYSKLPQALGCEGWFSTRVTTCGELDQAIEKAAVAELTSKS